MKITLMGYPGKVGGANTECLHTVHLWREAGWDVTLIPTWGPPDNSMVQELSAIGAKTLLVEKDKLSEVPGLAGATVISMCNARFMQVAGYLRETLNCKIAWLNCMTFLEDWERTFFHFYGPPDAMIYQSEFQRSMLDPVLTNQYGHNPAHSFLVRGAFSWKGEWSFNPRPHPPSTTFTIGRCARPDLDKWHERTYPILERIRYTPKEAILMGVGPQTARYLGDNPPWVQPLAPDYMPIREFYSRLHCCLPLNGLARENWPRVGLECLATGVPLVVPNRWGWKEMVIHNETGLLGDNAAELVEHVDRLATDENLRLRLARNGRDVLESTLASPDQIARTWQTIFDFLERKEPTRAHHPLVSELGIHRVTRMEAAAS